MEQHHKENFFLHVWKLFLVQDFFIKSSVVSLFIFLLAASSTVTYFTHASGNPTLSLTPIADTYINKSDPNKNYGTDDYLKSDKERITYIKFNLTSFAHLAIKRATFRLFVTNSSEGKQNIKDVLNTTWQENTLISNNRPPRSSTVETAITNTKKGQWKEIDLTADVIAHRGQIWSFAIDNPSGNDDSMYFYSKEHSTNKPQLILEFNATILPTSQPTPSLAPSPNQVVPSSTPIPSEQKSTPSPTLPTKTTSSNLPSSILNLANWKITLPIGQAGHPTEITQPELANYQIDPWFVVDTTKNGVRFRAPVNGVTTSGSSYPRSELREMTNNGTQQASWSTTVGTHTLTVKEASTHLPVVKPQVVTAQIHDASNDIIEIIADGLRSHAAGTYSICLRYNGPEQSTCLDDTYVPGTPYTIEMVASGGHIKILYNGVQKFDFINSGSGYYFKAGAYTQSNLSKGDAPDAYGEVIIYNLQVSHTQ